MADVGQVDDWLANANETINITISRPTDQAKVTEEPFHPAFTYSIFGDEETIFGYKDLKIDIDFRATDGAPKIDIAYSEKWKPVGDIKAMDIDAKLMEFLPYALDSKVPDPKPEWKPPGQLFTKYVASGRTFEIWYASLGDPEARQILQNIQIMIPFYIEGGTCQNLDDQQWTLSRWKLFLIYEVPPNKPETDANKYNSYGLVGFSTCYRLWVFPTSANGGLSGSDPTSNSKDSERFLDDASADSYDPLNASSRERISQFVVLPPFQGQSHGSRLYDAMVRLFLEDPHVFEFTVEDPNEAFDDMRDWSDLIRLRLEPEFASLAIPTTIPAEKFAKDSDIPRDIIVSEEQYEKLRRFSKISPRQFGRVVELQLLSTIPHLNRSRARITRKHNAANENDRKYYFWRLYVKYRLYLHNRDQLVQLDRDERVEKLDETLDNVEKDYQRLLEEAEKRWTRYKGLEDADTVTTGSGTNEKRKKRVITEDDEDMDEDNAPAPISIGSPSKKQRMEMR